MTCRSCETLGRWKTAVSRKSQHVWASTYEIGVFVTGAYQTGVLETGFKVIWHVTNNVTANTQGKLYKIRPFLNLLQSSFRNFYAPKRFLTVDEATIGFQCRLSCRQFSIHVFKSRGYLLLSEFLIRLVEICVRMCFIR